MYGVNVRERSFLILGTREEDNFAQLDTISYSIENIEKVFVPHHLSAKWLGTPIQKSLSKEHTHMDGQKVVFFYIQIKNLQY